MATRKPKISEKNHYPESLKDCKTVEGDPFIKGRWYITRNGKREKCVGFDAGCSVFPVETENNFLTRNGYNRLDEKENEYDIMRLANKPAKREVTKISGKVDDSATGISIKILRPDGTVRKTGTVDLKDVSEKPLSEIEKAQKFQSAIAHILDNMPYNLGFAIKRIVSSEAGSLNEAVKYIERQIEVDKK